MAVKVKLVDYFDVWGNAVDGWDVNNSLCIMIGDIELENFEDKTIIKALHEIGWLTKLATLETIEINDEYPFFEITEKETGFPLGRLEVFENCGGDIK